MFKIIFYRFLEIQGVSKDVIEKTGYLQILSIVSVVILMKMVTVIQISVDIIAKMNILMFQINVMIWNGLR